jgi:hypothetical protein
LHPAPARFSSFLEGFGFLRFGSPRSSAVMPAPVADSDLMVSWSGGAWPEKGKTALFDLPYVFPGEGNSGHLVTVQDAHEKAAKGAGLDAFEFYCWRHTFGTRCAESGMDKFTLARLMGHSSPHVAERYYIHVTEPHVMTGFERFVSYHNTRMANAVKQVTDAVQ